MVGKRCPVTYAAGKDKGMWGDPRREVSDACYEEFCRVNILPKFGEEEFNKCKDGGWGTQPWTTAGAWKRGMKVDMEQVAKDMLEAAQQGVEIYKAATSDADVVTKGQMIYAAATSTPATPSWSPSPSWTSQTQQSSYSQQTQTPAPKKGMSKGAKVGIAVGLLAVTGGAAWWFLRPKKVA